MSLTAPLRRSSSVAQSLTLLLLPHGGQAHARRNAWAGMSADAARGRDRRAAEAAMSVADVCAHARTALRDGTGR